MVTLLDERKLERIQKTATKMVMKFKDLQYEEQLKEMRLPIYTLKDRRGRGDLISLYDIVNGMKKVNK